MDYMILGAGGHAKVVLDAIVSAGGHKVVALTDNDRARCGREAAGLPVLHEDDAVQRHPPGSVLLVNGLGGRSSTADRRRYYARFRAMGYEFAVVTSPSAHVAASARLEPGAQILTRAVVHPDAAIGIDVIVNTAAVVEHDCVVGAHSFIGPAAVLCGRVRVGAGVFIGAGAIVLPELEVQDGSVVGAGAVVAKSLGPHARVAGVPAKPL
ncbi:MAG: NeuD/PglB/VioB family sugar acetyltransferase [Elusimicrobia bacterium]|nr:NeuD/PglB/VioB family sugar acetyltransferase [Elusimicrobiota bacterium]